MRALRPFGRSQLIVTSLASIAALAWIAWHWTDVPPTAAYRPPAPDPAFARAGVLPRPAMAIPRTEPSTNGSRPTENPGDARRAPDPAASADGRTHAHTTSAAPVAPGVGGRIVAIDPETGQLGAPSSEQIQALELAGQDRAVSRTDEGLRETVLANGTVIVDLDGRFQDYVVARVDRTGRLVHGCAHDVQGLAHALRDSTALRGLEVE